MSASRSRRSRPKTAEKTLSLKDLLAALSARHEDLVHHLKRLRDEADEALVNALDWGSELQDLAGLLERVHVAEPLLETALALVPSGRRVLSRMDTSDQLALDGAPLTWIHGDGKARPLSMNTGGGRLLMDLAWEEGVAGWQARELTRAVQQIRRSPQLGREAIAGRGREVRLTIPMRVSPELVIADAGRRAAKGRRRRP